MVIGRLGITHNQSIPPIVGVMYEWNSEFVEGGERGSGIGESKTKKLDRVFQKALSLVAGRHLLISFCNMHLIVARP